MLDYWGALSALSKVASFVRRGLVLDGRLDEWTVQSKTKNFSGIKPLTPLALPLYTKAILTNEKPSCLLLEKSRRLWRRLGSHPAQLHAAAIKGVFGPMGFSKKWSQSWVKIDKNFARKNQTI